MRRSVRTVQSIQPPDWIDGLRRRVRRWLRPVTDPGAIKAKPLKLPDRALDEKLRMIRRANDKSVNIRVQGMHVI